MTGVDIAGALLAADPAVTAMVPIAGIKAGRLPDGTPLPALLLRIVSSVDRPILKREEIVRRTDRVSVTVRADSYRSQSAAIRLAVSCLSGRVGDIGGGANVSILPDGVGPDVDGPANSFEQTADFKISYNTTP